MMSSVTGGNPPPNLGGGRRQAGWQKDIYIVLVDLNVASALASILQALLASFSPLNWLWRRIRGERAARFREDEIAALRLYLSEWYKAHDQVIAPLTAIPMQWVHDPQTQLRLMPLVMEATARITPLYQRARDAAREMDGELYRRLEAATRESTSVWFKISHGVGAVTVRDILDTGDRAKAAHDLLAARLRELLGRS